MNILKETPLKTKLIVSAVIIIFVFVGILMLNKYQNYVNSFRNTFYYNGEYYFITNEAVSELNMGAVIGDIQDNYVSPPNEKKLLNLSSDILQQGSNVYAFKNFATNDSVLSNDNTIQLKGKTIPLYFVVENKFIVNKNIFPLTETRKYLKASLRIKKSDIPIAFSDKKNIYK